MSDDLEIDLDAMRAAAGFEDLQGETFEYPEVPVEELRAQLAQLTAVAAKLPLCAPAMPEDFSASDVLCHADADCAVLCISFGCLPTPVDSEARFDFVGTCARAGIQHSLFVRDSHRRWFLRGGDDEFAAILRLLAPHLQRLRPKHIVTLGASAGGYAAIRAGIALGAAAVLAFGPQVVIAPGERAALQLPGGFYDRALRETAAAGVRMGSLIHAAAGASAATATAVEIHTGRLCPGDVREARLLQQAVAGAGSGVSVAVHVHRGLSHMVASGIGAEGFLEPLLRKHAGASDGDAASDVACRLPEGMRERFSTQTFSA